MMSQLAVVANKMPLLSSPGSVLSDDYYSPASCVVALAETTANTGRYTVELPSKTFGSSSTIYVPNQSFLGDCYLTFRLPDFPLQGAPPPFAYGTAFAWAFQAIDTLSFIWGGSNVGQLTITGHSLFQMAMAQCETSDKMSEILYLAGGLVANVQEASDVGNAPFRTEGTIKLVLPWSTNGGLHTKKWMDTSMLASPIQIIVKLADRTNVLGGDLTNAPTAFDSATFFTRQGDLSYKDQGMQHKMLIEPDLSSCYPFQYLQSFASAPFQGSVSGAKCNVVLQGFLNSDLVGIIVGVSRQSRRVVSQNPGAGNPNLPCPYAYDSILDVRLTLNGQVILNLPGSSYNATNMQSLLGGGFAWSSLSVGAYPGSGIPAKAVSNKIYPLFIDFSRLRSAVFTGEFFNVARYPGQPMFLEFFTQTAETNYILYATFVYNSVNIVKGGTSNIQIS